MFGLQQNKMSSKALVTKTIYDFFSNQVDSLIQLALVFSLLFPVFKNKCAICGMV